MAKIIVLGSHADSLLKFRRDMLQAMALHNHVVACVPNPTTAVIQEMQAIGVECIAVPLARTGLNPFADFSSLLRLYKIFKQLNADMIFTYTSKPVIFGTFAARLAGIKKCYGMITGLGTYFIYTDLKSTIIRTIMSFLYKIALHFNTKVFFQNPDDREVFAKCKIFSDPKRTVLINGSGVNLQHFAVQELPQNPASFILIARLILDKGVLEYLEAARMLRETYPQAKCLLVGWVDAKQHALNMDVVQQYVQRGAIDYLGSLEDVRPALAQASVFVLPSYREGTPKGVLEAMAAGRAIITTDAPGCRETVIPGENGYLVAVRNVQDLYAAMQKFVLNPELVEKMAQASRKLAEQKYDVHMVNKSILETMELQYA